ncbi:uncharacterized protein METZ01_LOCUS350552, partial [marine metagenome]
MRLQIYFTLPVIVELLHYKYKQVVGI